MVESISKCTFVLTLTLLFLYIVSIVLSLVTYYLNIEIYDADKHPKIIDNYDQYFNMTFPLENSVNSHVHWWTTHRYPHYVYKCKISIERLAIYDLQHVVDHAIFKILNKHIQLDEVTFQFSKYIGHFLEKSEKIEFECIRYFRFGSVFKHIKVYIELVPFVILLILSIFSFIFKRLYRDQNYSTKMILFLMVDILRIVYKIIYICILGFFNKQKYASDLDIFISYVDIIVITLNYIFLISFSSLSDDRMKSEKRESIYYGFKLYLSFSLLIISITCISLFFKINFEFLFENKVHPLNIIEGKFSDFLSTPLKHVLNVYILVYLSVILEIKLYIDRFLIGLI